MGKKGFAVYLEEEVYRRAREAGLNISRICENALKEAVRRLEGKGKGE